MEFDSEDMKTSRVQNIICLDPSSPFQFRKGGRERRREREGGRERRKEMFLKQIGIETAEITFAYGS